LLDRGWSVVGVDNLSTGDERNLAPLRSNPRFRFLRRDLRRPTRLPDCDAVFHLASPASPPRYQEDPIGTLEVNAVGTAHLLAHARAQNARFVITSTSEVYGDPEVHPQPETYWGHVNPIGIRSCYDEGKRFAEALTVAWQRQRGSDVRIARVFNTYGPNMDPADGRAVSNFMVQAWTGTPITVHGNGRQSRSFCYVDDLVRGLLALHDAPRVDGPVNLGNPRGEVTLIDLARRVRRVTGSASPIVFVKRSTDDPEQRRPDIRRARRLLGWAPTVSLEDGLQRTSAYFQRRLGAGRQ
jgi:nucleoside-diphosphate-sugar epimerase